METAALKRPSVAKHEVPSATEIRLRAEIRAGELLRDMAERGERADARAPGVKGERGFRAGTPDQPTLADLGVTK